LSDITTTPAVAIRMAAALAGGRDVITEEYQAEQRHLDGLGLDIGDGDDERALPHGGQHQRGRGDLHERAVEHPGPETRARPRQGRARDEHDAGQEEQREGKAEQEAHMGGADRAELDGQLALRRIARGLRRGRDDGEDGP
jgi:hypothetical protein